MNILERAAAKASCDRFLSGHHPRRTGRQWLEELAVSPLAQLPPDRYGVGGAIELLEREIATLLGKEGGVFVFKGMIAQQCALRVHCDRRQLRTVAIHPRSHVDLDEEGAYEHLHRLVPIRIGTDREPFTVRELEAISEPLGAVIVELPLRRSGFRLPSWDELTAISAWCRSLGIPLLLDGARLWESGPFFGRPYSEIADLAESVYVSFYKGLGGIAGCVLAGDEPFLEQVKLWKTRHGGNVYTSFPQVVAAKSGLDAHLPKMPIYWERAKSLAAKLASLDGVRVSPDPPHTNAFVVYLPRNNEDLARAALELAMTERVWLFDKIEPAGSDQLSLAEVQIGSASESLTDTEVMRFVLSLLPKRRV